MLGCQDIQEKISFFMEGEVSGSEEREVTTHLQNCPICQTEAERYKKLEKCLNSLIEANPPASMAPAIMSSLLKNKLDHKKHLIGMTQILAVFMGIFSLPLIALLLNKIFMLSHQTFDFFLSGKGFFVKLIIFIAKTLSSLLNDSPLFLDARIPLPVVHLLPFLLLAMGILITATIILSSFLFTFTLHKNYHPAKK